MGYCRMAVNCHIIRSLTGSLRKVAIRSLPSQWRGAVMVDKSLVAQWTAPSPFLSLVYSSAPLDSRVLFFATDDGHIHVSDSERKSFITSMSGHSSWVLSVDVSPDGTAIATGSSDKTVRLWDLKMRAATQILTSHTDQVWAVAFGPPLQTDIRSCLLVSVSDDKSLSFYKFS